jgi:hypothetical protein
MSPWDRLPALAERELELIRDGDIERLPEAIEERARLAASLGRAPASARPALQRLETVQQQIIVELTLAGAEIVRELGTLRRGRGAVNAYASSNGPAPGRVDGSA